MNSVYWFLLFYLCEFFSFVLVLGDYLFLISSWVRLTSSQWSFALSIFSRALLVDRHCSNLVLFCNVYLSLSIVTNSFGEYSNLGWYFWFLRVCRRSIMVILVFRVSTEKLTVILVDLPSYISWSFPLLLLIPFLWSVHLVD